MVAHHQICGFKCRNDINTYLLFHLLQDLPAYAVLQLVEALRYKLEDRAFDSRWGHWDFFY